MTKSRFLDQWAIELAAQQADLDWKRLGARFTEGAFVLNVTAALPPDEAAAFLRAVEAIDFRRARQLGVDAARLD